MWLLLLSLNSEPSVGHKGGSPVAVPPSSIAGFIIHSRSGPFLEDDSSIPASPWLTLTSGGGTPSSTPISQPLKSSPTTQASILPCPQPPLGLGHHLYLRKGTPLASRVAQGVSGPSSSWVWNPRVFADDAQGWQCPFVLCLHLILI